VRGVLVAKPTAQLVRTNGKADGMAFGNGQGLGRGQLHSMGSGYGDDAAHGRSDGGADGSAGGTGASEVRLPWDDHGEVSYGVAHGSKGVSHS
jgi:hypothetical protein